MSQSALKWHTKICDSHIDFIEEYSEPAVCAVGFWGRDVHKFHESERYDIVISSGREPHECCEYVLHFVCQECEDAKNERDRLAREAREQAEGAAASGAGGQAKISQEEAAKMRFKAASALLEMGDQGPSGENPAGSGNQDQQQSQGNVGSGGRGDHF
jgi:hypothetical protein